MAASSLLPVLSIHFSIMGISPYESTAGPLFLCLVGVVLSLGLLGVGGLGLLPGGDNLRLLLDRGLQGLFLQNGVLNGLVGVDLRSSSSISWASRFSARGVNMGGKMGASPG